jgi:hypothetical protein
VAVLRDLEAVRLGKPGQLLVAGLVDDLLVLLVPDVADALEEQQRENVPPDSELPMSPTRLL